jgi:hypothetical protein
MPRTVNDQLRDLPAWTTAAFLFLALLHRDALAECDLSGRRTFSLAADSPTLASVTAAARPGSGADLFTHDPNNPAGPPLLVASAESLGLMPSDDIDGLSFGVDATYVGPATDYFVCFSVDRAAVGQAPWDVNTEAGNPTYPEASADVFETDFPYATGGATGLFNFLNDDGDGSSASPLNLIDIPIFPPNDDLDALEGDPRKMDFDGNGVRDRSVYFSLRAGSPTLAVIGAGPGDILASDPPPNNTPHVFMTHAALGLLAGEDLEDFCLNATGATVNFTLPSGSPSLPLLGAGPGAVLKNGPLAVAWTASQFALVDGAAGDNMDALDCADPDSDGDGVPDDADCAPLSNLVWGIPGEATSLVLTGTNLGWTAPTTGGTPASMIYDVLRSSTASNFSAGTICLVSDAPGTAASDPANPVAGSRYYYLVGAQNVCGRGSLGATSRGVQRTGIACP